MTDAVILAGLVGGLLAIFVVGELLLTPLVRWHDRRNDPWRRIESRRASRWER